MKQIVLTETGGPESFSVRAADLAPPGPHEIRIRNSAIGVNFIDIYQRRGLYPVATPCVLGQEGAGTVIAAGADQPFKTGDRVAYLSGGGAYAEEIVLDAGRAAPAPISVGVDEAAAGFLKGLTAEMLVRQVFPLTQGRTALVTAAAGGVGTLLVQWARHLGATIIAIVGGPEKAQAAAANGADHTIDRYATPDIASAVRTLTNGRGVDVVYDSVGAATFQSSLDSLAIRGMMVTYGNASGPVPPIAPLELSRRGSLSLIRPSLFHYSTPDRLPEMAAALFDLMGKGVLKPAVAARFPLEKAANAHRLLEAGKTIGSIVLKP
ncbi:MAG: quinone oxidoreductase [Parvularculaceae bacterium]|nr:quinone oxidoreductase [Parvularculaceae bacterium]